MNDHGISKRTFDLLMKTFGDFPEVEQVVLFGSRAKGNYNSGSDIDLAVKGNDVSPALIFKLNSMNFITPTIRVIQPQVFISMTIILITAPTSLAGPMKAGYLVPPFSLPIPMEKE